MYTTTRTRTGRTRTSRGPRGQLGRELRAFTITVALASATTILAAPPALAGHTAAGMPGEEPFSRACFMVQSHWNTALDGAQPKCPAPEPAPPSGTGSGDPDPVSGADKLARR
jgi:hypothetical protein